MKNQNLLNPAPSQETVWAILQEVAQSQKENNKQLQKLKATFEKQKADREKQKTEIEKLFVEREKLYAEQEKQKEAREKRKVEQEEEREKRKAEQEEEREKRKIEQEEAREKRKIEQEEAIVKRKIEQEEAREKRKIEQEEAREKRKIEQEEAREKRKAEQEEEREKRKIEQEEAIVKQKAEQEKAREKEREEARVKAQKESERRWKEIEKTMGSWANNHGEFAEEYFFNSFENGQTNFFGEKFEEIEKNAKGIKKKFVDEYDIVMINGKSVGIIEVKFKAHENDIPKILRKAETFRINFPYYENHMVYLGLATLAFYPELEKVCRENGIAIIKQLGDTVVINDEHLKVF